LYDAAGGAFVGILIVALLVGAWAWILLLFKKGPRALLGYDQVVIHQFESAILYKNGVFDRILVPGVHWTSLKNRMMVKVDMRPEVVQIAQGAVTSDYSPVLLRCVARIQVKDPRAAIESAQNYRHEAYVRLQSVVKTIANQRSFRDLQIEHDAFNAVAQKHATEAIANIGCECIGFELLQAEPSGSLADLDDKKMGFGPH
jgi:regulator of protease activity HflC (stomatin/prohibitin superfamily)